MSVFTDGQPHQQKNSDRGRFPFSLKTSKFWLRLLRPWKWRNLKRSRDKNGMVRSGSADVIRSTPNVIRCPPSPSLPSLMHSRELASLPDFKRRQSHDVEASAAALSSQEEMRTTYVHIGDESSLEESLESVPEVKNSPPRAPGVEVIRVRAVSHQPQKHVVFIQDNQTFIDSTALPGTNEATLYKPLQVDLSHSLTVASNRQKLDFEAFFNGEETENEDETSDLMRPKDHKQQFAEVAAKEPDLNAIPGRPALRRPGQPSRVRLRPPNNGSPKKNVAEKRTVINDDGLITRLTDDSDSDGEIQYRDDPISTPSKSLSDLPPLTRSDDEEDEEEEPAIADGLASKVFRKDTFALRLDVKEDFNGQTPDERRENMQNASAKLLRKLSERPTANELMNRNILRGDEEASTMEEKRKMLLRKLSFRPTIQQLKDQQIIQFNDYVEVTEAEIYDRKADKPWTRLTPSDKALIRKELNDFKQTEMDVHVDSRKFTRLHKP
ncbi:unnamed protein product, partial [Mesorhabditis belari]|uniref:Phosphatase and actin regulator n=1 Tax=Mesorhabditis belari TaxID=2138241 RepID=A0AAF3EV88_9BILA